MKKCILLFFIFLSAGCYAQDKKQFVETLLKNNSNRIYIADKPSTLPNVSFIILPQDNMPCLVPDLTAMAVMPVQRFAGDPSAIPNPYSLTEQLPGTINSNNTPGINFFQKRDKGLFRFYILPETK